MEGDRRYASDLHPVLGTEIGMDLAFLSPSFLLEEYPWYMFAFVTVTYKKGGGFILVCSFQDSSRDQLGPLLWHCIAAFGKAA